MMIPISSPSISSHPVFWMPPKSHLQGFSRFRGILAGCYLFHCAVCVGFLRSSAPMMAWMNASVLLLGIAAVWNTMIVRYYIAGLAAFTLLAESTQRFALHAQNQFFAYETERAIMMARKHNISEFFYVHGRELAEAADDSNWRPSKDVRRHLELLCSTVLTERECNYFSRFRISEPSDQDSQDQQKKEKRRPTVKTEGEDARTMDDDKMVVNPLPALAGDKSGTPEHELMPHELQTKFFLGEVSKNEGDENSVPDAALSAESARDAGSAAPAGERSPLLLVSPFLRGSGASSNVSEESVSREHPRGYYAGVPFYRFRRKSSEAPQPVLSEPQAAVNEPRSLGASPAGMAEAAAAAADPPLAAATPHEPSSLRAALERIFSDFPGHSAAGVPGEAPAGGKAPGSAGQLTAILALLQSPFLFTPARIALEKRLLLRVILFTLLETVLATVCGRKLERAVADGIHDVLSGESSRTAAADGVPQRTLLRARQWQAVAGAPETQAAAGAPLPPLPAPPAAGTPPSASDLPAAAASATAAPPTANPASQSPEGAAAAVAAAGAFPAPTARSGGASDGQRAPGPGAR